MVFLLRLFCRQFGSKTGGKITGENCRSEDVLIETCGYVKDKEDFYWSVRQITSQSDEKRGITILKNPTMKPPWYVVWGN